MVSSKCILGIRDSNKTEVAIYYFFRNHLLDKTLKTKINGQDVKLFKQILQIALKSDASPTEFRKAYKIKPEHLECKVFSKIKRK